MQLIDRYLSAKIVDDLRRKMVFLGGPRQVGKTSLAEKIMSDGGARSVLLNWDDDQDRAAINAKEFPFPKGLIVFDEIHKNRRWRNYLKGLFDKRKQELQILVTGSARLDLYRFGGDSLQGRYFYHRLHPFSVKELGIRKQNDLENLMRLSGFPEPYFAQSAIEKKRWSNTYRARLVREDLADLERVQDLSTIELLAQRLPTLVGSPLSLNNIREDLQVAHATVEKWILMLEKLYYVYRILPYGLPKVRAVKKMAKHYHFDWSLPSEVGAQFENLIAGHLLKWCHYQEDVFGRSLELRYYRDSEGREVDFLIIEDGKPSMLVEAKLSFSSPSIGLRYLKSRFPAVRAIQVTLEDHKTSVSAGGIEQISALSFLNELI